MKWTCNVIIVFWNTCFQRVNYSFNLYCLTTTTGNIRYTIRRKTNLKYNTICFRHHYSQTSTNNVNKIWTVDCVLVPASSTLHTVLDYTRLLYTSSLDNTDSDTTFCMKHVRLHIKYVLKLIRMITFIP
jgi:hypothetical protein